MTALSSACFTRKNTCHAAYLANIYMTHSPPTSPISQPSLIGSSKPKLQAECLIYRKARSPPAETHPYVIVTSRAVNAYVLHAMPWCRSHPGTTTTTSKLWVRLGTCGFMRHPPTPHDRSAQKKSGHVDLCCSGCLLSLSPGCAGRLWLRFMLS
jgi:hypothetical protein